MSEFPPPAGPVGAAGAAPEALTPAAVEAVLADFRAWLQEAAGPGVMLSRPPETPVGADAGVGRESMAPPREPPDLHTLLEQFVALRHEVNLQTKASRTQQEQNAEALRRLGEALDALGRAGAQDADEALRPVLKTLADLYDALALARREVQRVQEAVLPLLDQAAAAPAAEAPAPTTAAAAATVPRRSFWARWFGGTGAGLQRTVGDQQEVIAALQRKLAAAEEQLQAQQQQREQTAQAAERVRQFVASLVTGYTMSVQRLERALQQHGLEPIRCVGEPFDPETMEVVEVVTEGGRGGTEVVAEVRRGYRWRGRVFRFAQVKVARGG
jgi:molecular chaperone GrpE